MPTPQQYAGQTGAVRPMDGVVPGLTWDTFMSAINNGTNIAANYSQPAGAYTMGEGGGFSGGITPRAYDIPGLGTVGIIANGGQDAYTQDVGDGTTNWFTRNPDGTVGSQNRTQNNDSWWDSTGLPLVASLAFGGATAGLSAAGVGVSGAGAGAANVGAGALGADGASAAFGGGASAAGSAVGNLGTFPQYGTGFEGGDGFLNISDAATGTPYETLAPVTVTGSAAGTGGLTAGELAAGAGGLGLAGGLAAGFGGGPSGTGQSFSDAGYASANNTPYSGNANDSIAQSSTASKPTSTNPFSAIKDFYENGFGADPSSYWSLASGAGSLLSGILGTNAAKSAQNAQTNAANQNNVLANRIFDTNTALNQPFVSAGTGAIGTLGNLYGLNGTAAQTKAYDDFKTSPDYQFAFDQGQRAVQSSAAAAGGLYSGRAAKDLTTFGQGAASQQYGKYTAGLTGIAQLGQASANQQSANGNNLLANVSGNNNAIGNAQAAGTNASTNAITGAINGALGQTSNNQLLKLLQGNLNLNGYYNTGTI